MKVNIELNKKNKLSFMARQVSGRSVLGTLESNSLKGKQMQRILSLVVAALAMLASSAAFAYLEDGQVPPELTMIPVDMSFRVLDNGYGVVMVIDDTTGLPIHDQWGQECSGPAPDVSGRCASQLAFPAVAAIIIGAGTGALGVAAAGGNAGQILSGAILGGVFGFYGAIAGITTGISRVLYGSYSALYGGGMVGLVGRTSP